MKLRQKTKYVAIGVIGAVLAIPFALKAVDSIPLTFKSGDVISAEVINNLFGRLNDVQKGITSNSELVGTWNCTSRSIRTDCTSPWTKAGSNLWSTITQTLTISEVSGGLQIAASVTDPSVCYMNANQTVTAELSDGRLGIKQSGPNARIGDLQKVSPTRFVLNYSTNTPPDVYTVCDKALSAPAPANNVTGVVTGLSVALTWIDQSSDETGFKVQRKASATDTWASVATTAANSVSYTDTVTAGSYWYRVIATNGNGDAISSNEIQITAQ